MNIIRKILIVINAACFSDDLNWLQKHLHQKDIEITDAKKDGILLAIQGPKSEHVMKKVFGINISKLKFFSYDYFKFNEVQYMISKSGFSSSTVNPHLNLLTNLFSSPSRSFGDLSEEIIICFLFKLR